MKFFIGTAGWSYKDWEGVFYPGKTSRGFDKLQYYATLFNIAEINASYYSYLNPLMVSTWSAKLSDFPDFTFTIKLHGDITHKRRYSNKNITDTKTVLSALAADNRLKGVLAQFPYSFQHTAESARYINELITQFSDYPIFFEFRHSGWIKGAGLKFINESGINICAIDMPMIGEAFPFRFTGSADSLYVRLHGRNSAGWMDSIRRFAAGTKLPDQNARYHYNYSPSEMHELRMKIENEIAPGTKELVVIFNNHPFGYAPANALEMKIMLERIQLDLPLHLSLNFPRLVSHQ